MRFAAIIGAVLVLLFAAAGCGGGSDEASPDTDTVVTTETTTEETTTEQTETSELGGILSEDCQELLAVAATLGQAFAAAGSGAGDTDETSKIFDELAGKVPDEIRGDLQVLAEGYREYAEVVKDLDLQSGETPSADDLQKIQAALAAIDQPEMQAASERISAWAEANCGG